jgi:pyrroline-5-carboxylate reductase
MNDDFPKTAFIGGGNMAQAILGGLRAQGVPASSFVVVEPSDQARERLLQTCGQEAQPAPDERLAACELVVWAVKPQVFEQAAAAARNWVAQAVQLSIMAGVRCQALQQATGAPRIVRAMPNTPALIGRGIAGLYAVPAVDAGARAQAAAVLAPTGSLVWVSQESDLDAVTALSGSGPAYMFLVIEAMVQAGAEMGLPPAQARQLAQETMAGAAALAMQSSEEPATLRERVTSRGGTTHAALTVMEEAGVKPALVRAMHAACTRARELGGG